MTRNNPSSLAAELRARAFDAKPKERDDLLFLAAEYEQLTDAQEQGAQQQTLNVLLPR